MNCPDCPICYKHLLEISTRPPLLRPQPVPNFWPIRRYYWEELTNESMIPCVQACLVCNQQWGCLSMYRIPNKIISFAGNIPEKKRITACPRIIERYMKHVHKDHKIYKEQLSMTPRKINSYVPSLLYYCWILKSKIGKDFSTFFVQTSLDICLALRWSYINLGIQKFYFWIFLFKRQCNLLNM